MNLSTIKKAGEGAEQLIGVVRTMNTMDNTYSPKYMELLSALRSQHKDAALTFATLTDAQVNQSFLNGLGDAEAIGMAKRVLGFWETLIFQLKDATAQIGTFELGEVGK